MDASNGAAGGGAAGGSRISEANTEVVGWVGSGVTHSSNHGRSSGDLQGGVPPIAADAGESSRGESGDERVDGDDAGEDDCDYFHLGARTFRAGWRTILSIVTEASLRSLHGAYWEWREANEREERIAAAETYRGLLRELRRTLFTGWNHHPEAGGYYTRRDRPGRWSYVTLMECRDNMKALTGDNTSESPVTYDACLGMEVIEQYCE